MSITVHPVPCSLKCFVSAASAASSLYISLSLYIYSIYIYIPPLSTSLSSIALPRFSSFLLLFWRPKRHNPVTHERPPAASARGGGRHWRNHSLCSFASWWAQGSAGTSKNLSMQGTASHPTATVQECGPFLSTPPCNMPPWGSGFLPLVTWPLHRLPVADCEWIDGASRRVQETKGGFKRKEKNTRLCRVHIFGVRAFEPAASPQTCAEHNLLFLEE